MKCTLCNGKNIEMINSKIRNIENEKIKIYRCTDCGVHFLYPYYDQKELEKFYNGEYRKEYSGKEYYSENNIENFFNKSLEEAKNRVERVKKYIDKKHDILEIGCASGYFLYSIKDYVKSARGTEWDENNAKYARKIGFEVKNNAKDFNKKFDRIFMFHVLEHILDPIGFLRDLKKYLKKDGLIFIEVPNNEDILLDGYDIKEFKDFYYQSAHVYNFNKNSLSYVINESGLNAKILYVQRYDISNHIQWLKKRTPGGQGMYDHLFTADFKKNYENMLIEQGKSDTLFSICKISDKVGELND